MKKHTNQTTAKKRLTQKADKARHTANSARKLTRGSIETILNGESGNKGGARLSRQRHLLQLQRIHGNSRAVSIMRQTMLKPSVKSQPVKPSIQRAGDMSPEEEFLDDLKTGTEQAAKYVEYISKALDYMQKTGKGKPSGIYSAAANLRKISSSVKGGLDKFAGKVGQVKDLVAWLDSLDTLADAAQNVSLDKASIDALINAIDNTTKKSKPLIEGVKGWAAKLAKGGSRVAGRVFFVTAVFSAYFEVGAAALKAGLTVVHEYHERKDPEKYMARMRRRERMKEPSYPGDWMTAKEAKVKREAYLAYLSRAKKAAEADKKRRAVIKKFNEEIFPKIYMRKRRRIYGKILHGLRYDKKMYKGRVAGLSFRAEGHGPRKWWECLKYAERGYEPFPGTTLGAKKRSIWNIEDAKDEIYQFKRVRPRFPYFDNLYERAFKTYMTKALLDKK